MRNIGTIVLILTAVKAFATLSFEGMTLEEKAGQLLMVHFNGEDVNVDAAFLIQKVHVGGFIYYNWANGLHSPRQVRQLSGGLQQLAMQTRSAIPLLIAIDQEGGFVSRLHKGFTSMPGNKALAMAGDPLLAEASAFIVGRELRAVGINMNLAPVVDIHSNPKNPVIGIRSFGESAEIVIPYARSMLEGYHKAGMLTSLKHFPGHGDVDLDSHEYLPVLNKSKERLLSMELQPFRILANKADTIMTAHIIVPALDPMNCATLSENVLNFLRHETAFEGVIISDSLVMEGLLKNCPSVDEAAIRAFEAGCDVLLLGGKQLVGARQNFELTVSDIQRIHQAIVAAVKQGRISEDRLNASVERILKLKSRITVETQGDLGMILDLGKHEALSAKIASLAIRVIKAPAELPLEKVGIFAPEFIKERLMDDSFMALGKSSQTVYFNHALPSDEQIQSALETARNADVLVICTYNAWKYHTQEGFIHTLMKYGKPVAIISLGDLLDTAMFPEADMIIETFSPSESSIKAAFDLLRKRYE